jgi:cell division protease FtsH
VPSKESDSAYHVSMTSQKPEFRPSQPGNDKRPDDQGRSVLPDQSWRWIIAALIALAVLVFIVEGSFGNNKYKSIPYDAFTNAVTTSNANEKVASATIDNTTGEITGNTTVVNGKASFFRTNGPAPPTEDEIKLLQDNHITLKFKAPKTGGILDYVMPIAVTMIFVIGIIYFLRRQAQGQMNGMMSIGRSKAKIYTTERPKTTFADVAGYTAAKQEISEVVDFLKDAQRFEEIGAKIPKGVLLVGPPGTGKTLLARAVAGEAGVPFMSVTGSDFMEMFVGVGASRVRDLFQTARKNAPAIVFIDEIDSIGRKRGAGLGGGHDEREQTLNQMLSEMDGFEASEGVVMMAATNRPDILDPALLRPGRFDRQITVPLPDLDERLPILQVHTKERKLSPDVNLDLVARGTPGMSGADLANLVNEAALHAVRRGAAEVHMRDFEAARDRIIMGQRRESLVLSDEEKERVAYHEGGHAVLSYVLPDADPLHKVTILPTGMALGVTQQLPLEEQHIYRKAYIEDRLAVRMGGRVAELLVYGDYSTGASNDLVGNTDLATKMVTEWGMSDRIGPAAWGSQGQVFLGDDLLHSGEKYSANTSNIIDDEVGIILRASEKRATEFLTRHREGLNRVAAELLDRETIDGSEVARLVDEAYGRPVHPETDKRPHYTSPLAADDEAPNGVVGLGGSPQTGQ